MSGLQLCRTELSGELVKNHIMIENDVIVVWSGSLSLQEYTEENVCEDWSAVLLDGWSQISVTLILLLFKVQGVIFWSIEINAI